MSALVGLATNDTHVEKAFATPRITAMAGKAIIFLLGRISRPPVWLEGGRRRRRRLINQGRGAGSQSRALRDVDIGQAVARWLAVSKIKSGDGRCDNMTAEDDERCCGDAGGGSCGMTARRVEIAVQTGALEASGCRWDWNVPRIQCRKGVGCDDSGPGDVGSPPSSLCWRAYNPYYNPR